ncbi:TlpA family protein disulfide reductase [Alicyclobacillus sp. ALC3]|uniref:TlpA family protein disulfide reductase n=1 Tax=Alicyclobacillus sp. ALC3 TaxID=2796143 RepID=UPI0023780524|nr:TlpA disulfide reductase family protein [Alicyclobacillus sp. ALC3]
MKLAWRVITPLIISGMLVGGCGTTPTQSNVSRHVKNNTPPVSPNVTNTTVSGSSTGGFISVGSRVPNFTLKNLSGHGQTSLDQLLGKKPLIINAWASWCPPCQAETPDLEQAFKKFSSQVQFIGVNLTSIDSVSGAQAFVKKYGVTYPVLLDTKGQFWQSYTVLAYPTTFVISPQGKLIYMRIGAMSKSGIAQLVQMATSK